MASDTKRRRVWPRRAAIALAAAIVLAAIGFGAYVGDYYHAGAQAESIVDAGADASGQRVEQTGSSIAVGDPGSEYGVVLYPGAKVAAQAYVPLACELADRGVYCVIVKMPFNLAFFGTDSADALMEQSPQVKHWWLAGHSLGGAMGAQYASGHADALEGIAFLGAYSASDLSAANLRALVIYGDADGVLNRGKLAECESNLPARAQTVVIEGGNHAGFADYGPQAGDGEASIDPSDQQSQTAEAIAAAMRE